MDAKEAIEAVETIADTNVVGYTSYAILKPADALAHLNERLAAEADLFERDTGLRLASVKVTRVKDTDELKSLQAHVR
jgi:hypothetical protein